MNNFSINPNFQFQGFDNSITDFNKTFSQSLNDANKNFDEVFNSMSPANNAQMSQTPLTAGIQEFQGIDTIAQSKVENLNPTAKMASDIGKGISDSLQELNTVQRNAESDFETFAAGGDISVHEVMISAQKSNLAMQMAIQLRNQALSAYNEFKSMTV